jgi:hypothetical protein
MQKAISLSLVLMSIFSSMGCATMQPVSTRKPATTHSLEAKISCRVGLSGLHQPAMRYVRQSSAPIDVSRGGNFFDGDVNVTFGSFLLQSALSISGGQNEDGSSERVRPTWNIKLVENSSHHSDASVFNMSQSNLNLDTRAVGDPMVVDSVYFLNGSYDGKDFTRVDVHCSLERL